MSSAWISALRTSHDRFAALVTPLSADEVTQPSYASEWTIADTASHLGSQAEIFSIFLAAGLAGQTPPGGEAFPPIWDRWNATAPAQQVASSVEANEAFVSRLEALTDGEQASFTLDLFGSELDLDGFCGMRLGEHALHTWDIAVALDPNAVVSADAVELLVDRLGATAARVGKPVEDGRDVVVETSLPLRTFVVTTSPEVTLTQGAEDGVAELDLPAEAFVRLVFGRLDEGTVPESSELELLRRVFPGF
jgi:uncharacterized protein (TIGR03083 family)